MDDEFGLDPSEGSTEPGTTRRTLVRTAANAAWAVPLVSIATTAPAHAAASTTTTSMRIDSATFYLLSDGTSTTLYPLITVTNPTGLAVDTLSISLEFSTDYFTGADGSFTPPIPTYVNGATPIPSSSAKNDWEVVTVIPSKNATTVIVRLRKLLGLDPGETSTVGASADDPARFGIVFSNNPTVDSVPMYVTSGKKKVAVVTAGDLLKVAAPT